MNESTLFQNFSLLFGLWWAAVAVITLLLSPKTLPWFEKLPRNRYVGILIGWVAMFGCIPHAAAVAPAFLLPYLLPIAVVTPVLCFFFVDYLFSRAVGGSFILIAYYFLHASFNTHYKYMPLLAVFCWLLGILGMWISAKPHIMREYIRSGARTSAFRWIAAAVALVCMTVFGLGYFLR